MLTKHDTYEIPVQVRSRLQAIDVRLGRLERRADEISGEVRKARTDLRMIFEEDEES